MPSDAIAARDAELLSALAKAGALVGNESCSTTIVINGQTTQLRI